MPEVWDLVKDTPLAATAKNNLTEAIALGPGTATRLQYMDKEGIHPAATCLLIVGGRAAGD